MLTEWAYAADSEVMQDEAGTLLRLFPNLRRPPTHLRTGLADPLAFRDAMLALHDCARSEHFVSSEEIEHRAADPVVTVTPGAVFFEAFSLDESAYGRVTLRQPALRAVERLTPGCTNVDFSPRLRAGIERIRSSSPFVLQVEAGALEVNAVREERIDLPDGWAHGFFAIQASLRRPAVQVELHPTDLRNLVAYLRGRKESVSPRSLRFQLRPGEPPSILVEPWCERLTCSRSRHEASAPQEMRVWGRRRLLALGRLPPAADAIPLEGWPSVPEETMSRVAAFLTQAGQAFADEVAAAAGLEPEAALAALDALCAAGRVLYDPEADLFHVRRLFLGDPPPPPAPEQHLLEARRIVQSGGVAVHSREAGAMEGCTLEAVVKGKGSYSVNATLDASGHLLRGACTCLFFSRFAWRRGPCKPLLAVRETEAR